MTLVEAAPAASPSLGSQEQRIIEAALRCFARWGLAKTTLDDIAREAGYSRATVYRFFPGGKDGLVDAVVRHEVASFFEALRTALADAPHLEDLLVAGMTEAVRLFDEHRTLQYLVTHEPEVILPHISFHHMDEVLAVASAEIAPYLSRFTDRDPHRAAEWIVRIFVSYVCCPSTAVDMRSPQSVRELVRTFVVPGLVS